MPTGNYDVYARRSFFIEYSRRRFFGTLNEDGAARSQITASMLRIEEDTTHAVNCTSDIQKSILPNETIAPNTASYAASQHILEFPSTCWMRAIRLIP